MDENALILDASRGDLEAFNRLVLAYQDILYNQAYRIMGDKNSAERRDPGRVHFGIQAPVNIQGRFF